MPDVRLVNLVNGNYFRGIQLTGGAGAILGNSLNLTGPGATWLPQSGVYPSTGARGYWIFRTDVDQCWQVNEADPRKRLQYWNADGRAKGLPEDWELFAFEFLDPAIDPTQSYVAAKNVNGMYGRFLGPVFQFDGTKNDAFQFQVVFSDVSAAVMQHVAQIIQARQPPPARTVVPHPPPRGG